MTTEAPTIEETVEDLRTRVERLEDALALAAGMLCRALTPGNTRIRP